LLNAVFANSMSALPSRADMCGAIADVSYGPKADINAAVISFRNAQMSRQGTSSDFVYFRTSGLYFLGPFVDLGWFFGGTCRPQPFCRGDAYCTFRQRFHGALP